MPENANVMDEVIEVMPKSVVEMLSEFFASPLGEIAKIAIVVVLVLIGAKIVLNIVRKGFRKTIDRMNAEKNPNAMLVNFAQYAVIALIYFGAFSIIVSNIPALDAGITKLMAAGGVVAVVVGVAGQDALSSVAAGMMILVFRPFVVGDVVNVLSAGVAGTVEDINLRHTVLRTWENKRIIVPNSTMSGAIIENFDYGEKTVCLSMDVGITYETDLDRALEVLAEVVGAHPSYLDQRTEEDKANGVPKVPVRVQELGDSAVVLRAMLWGEDNGTTAGMRFDLQRQVKKAFDENGIEMAYPHLVVVQDK
ncbi:MAG: mechanosensitive ion channel family protein [Butyricicoccus sp.]|nr:mechanosensitive ion channel family protein [Butyricicoccus sp.]MBQ8584803.1 mechanosensitive ion channel family protein [Butyricicoccus sp.]